MLKNTDKDRKINKLDIIRYIIGIIFILGGLGGMTSGNSFLGGLAIILLGISFFPIIYRLLKCYNNKVLQIIIPIILLFISFTLMPKANTITITNSTNIIPNKNVENINDNKNENEIITNELKDFNDFNDNSKQTENKIDDDTENEIDNKIENDEVSKTKNNKQKIDQSEKEEDKKISNVKKEENTAKPAITNKNETNTTQTAKDNSRKVYRTPSGNRYHYDSDCGGKNSYSVTLNDAISSGLTPCKKCVL